MKKTILAALFITAALIFTVLPAFAATYIEITVDNYLTSITLVKKSATSDKTLSGATYELYTADEQFVGRYTTEKDGKIEINGLTHGEYYFVEITPPQGYELSTEKLHFTVDEKSARLEVVGLDTPIPTPQPHTGERTGIYVMAGIAGTTAIAAFMLIRRRKKGQK